MSDNITLPREDAVRMAREAGFNQPWTAPKETQERLTRFATLAAEWGAKQEREACAKVCDVGVDYPHPTVKGVVLKDFGSSELLAKAIRVRGEVPR